MKNPSIERARERVADMIANSSVPANLVGAVEATDLIELVETVATQNIKQHLTEINEMSDEDALEHIQSVMESAALEVGLVCVQATIQELMDGGGLGADADLDLGLSADTVTALLSGLLRGEGVTVRLNVS